MDIKERLSRVEANTNGLATLEQKVDDAYSLSKQNKQDIEDLRESSRWTTRTAIVAVIIPFGLFLLERFLIK